MHNKDIEQPIQITKIYVTKIYNRIYISCSPVVLYNQAHSRKERKSKNEFKIYPCLENITAKAMAGSFNIQALADSILLQRLEICSTYYGIHTAIEVFPTPLTFLSNCWQVRMCDRGNDFLTLAQGARNFYFGTTAPTFDTGTVVFFLLEAPPQNTR